jgi:hypothetical protein
MRDEITNHRDSCSWTVENPNEIKETYFHHRFFCKYVVLVIGIGIIRPFVFEHILTAERYINFHENHYQNSWKVCNLRSNGMVGFSTLVHHCTL